MKFIKDIIGEKREKVQQRGLAPEQGRPDQDMMAGILAETRAAQETFQLGSSFRVGAEPEPGPVPADSQPETYAEAASTPDEDAIAAFFANARADEQAASAPGSGIGWEAELDDDGGFGGADDDDIDDDALDGGFSSAAESGAGAEEANEFAMDAGDGTGSDDDTGDGDGIGDDGDDFGFDHNGGGGGSDAERQERLAALAAGPGGARGGEYRIFRRRGNQELDAEEETGEGGFGQATGGRAAEPQPQRGAGRVNALSGLSRPAAHAAPQDAPRAAPPVPRGPDPLDSAGEAGAAAPIDVPAPSMGRGASRAGRVKTRLLGFSPEQAAGADPFARGAGKANPGYSQFPVGWLAVVNGPGRGAAFTLFSGVSVIGRGENQTVRLDFGDNSISRDNHAAIAYDPEQKCFFIGHGGKANLVRRNNRPVLSTEELQAGDIIRIGETTLRFVPLCGADFGWDMPQQGDSGHAGLR